MRIDKNIYKQYIAVLEEELVPALGCTEPTCIAYAAALTARCLGGMPDHLVVESSGNIIKNVKGAVVPNSGGLKGLEAAAVLGAAGGNPELKLEVLTGVTEEAIELTKKLLEDRDFCEVRVMKPPANLHVRITGMRDGHEAKVELIHQHTNLVRIEKDGLALYEKPYQPGSFDESLTDRGCLNVLDILAFADEVQMEDIQELIDRQIEYNERIAQEGMQKEYGVSVGANLVKYYGNDVQVRARAMAAAGSDARMSGCLYPVVINSGSGNQGITVSVPVIEYAKEMGVSHEKLVRALVFSNLIAIHQKTGIGRLSAYCGAVSAACGAGAGITYLSGGSYEQICATITNTLANVSGMICDGAKPSCAAKIATAVDAAIMAHCLSMEAEEFQPGDGIVKDTVENTIESVCEIASQGMNVTDAKILEIMVR